MSGALAAKILAGNATISDYLAAPKEERGSPLQTFLKALIGEATLGGNTVKKARIITKIRVLASQFTVGLGTHPAESIQMWAYDLGIKMPQYLSCTEQANRFSRHPVSITRRELTAFHALHKREHQLYDDIVKIFNMQYYHRFARAPDRDVGEDWACNIKGAICEQGKDADGQGKSVAGNVGDGARETGHAVTRQNPCRSECTSERERIAARQDS